jgi:uncharacterized membrane protein YbhN (UPF0104 family)
MKKKYFSEILGAALFIAAAAMLYHQVKSMPSHDFMEQLKIFPPKQLLAGLLMVALNYIVLIYYDVLSFYYIQHPMKFRNIALASFIGNAFNNNLSLSGVAAASVRFRLYDAWGLKGKQIAQIIFFYHLTFIVGFIAVGAAVFTLTPAGIPKLFHLPFHSAQPIGFVFITALGLLSFFILTGRNKIKILRWELALPSRKLYGFQLLAACAEWLVSAGVLYVLLAPVPGFSFLEFTGIFLLVQMLGFASQVPGGIGVLEWGILVFLKRVMPVPRILAGLLAFRLTYYLLPFFISIVMLGIHEWIAKNKLRREKLMNKPE